MTLKDLARLASNRGGRESESFGVCLFNKVGLAVAIASVWPQICSVGPATCRLACPDRC